MFGKSQLGFLQNFHLAQSSTVLVMFGYLRNLFVMCGLTDGHARQLPLGGAHLFDRSPIRSSTLIALLVSLAAVGASFTRPASFKKNLYVEQADAFLHARLNVNEFLNDAVLVNGKLFVPFPPMPALLLTPWVALFGPERASALPLAVLLTIMSLLILARLVRQLGVGWDRSCWVLLAFFLGTGYWYVLLQSNGVWYLAHVVATFFVLLAIYLAWVGESSLAGLALGCAVLSRQMTIYSSVFLLALLLRNSTSTRVAIKRVLAFAWPLAVCVMAYLVFNWARFGNPFDTGYSHIMHAADLKDRYAHHGLFSPAYLVHNIIYMFLQGPHVEFDGLMPKGMDPWGTSLLFASPFVLLAVLARPAKPLLWAAWLSVCLPLFNQLLYYSNGWIQSNTQRYTLDFMPVLIILVALAAQRVDVRLLRAAAGYSVALNTAALLVIPLIPRVAVHAGLG